MEDSIKIIQISDTHLLADPDADLLHVKTNESLKAALSMIEKKNHGIDLILHTGDISQDGSMASYERLADLLDGFHVPVYCAPGNHDDVVIMQQVFPRNNVFFDRQILFDHWQIIILNSQVPGKVEGGLSLTELELLEKSLRQYSNHNAIVVLHHHPIPVASDWLDKLGLTNAETFWGILHKHPNVKTVLFGHIHQTIETHKEGILCCSAPSTCIQFMRNKSTFGLENLPPGFRWLDLFNDGTVKTGVERVEKYVGVFDDKATGY